MEKYYLGFDAGSTYVKSALIRGNEVVCTKVLPTGIDNDRTSKILKDELLKMANITDEDVAYITATGYSRRNIAIANDTISEITAHAYGTKLTAPEGIKPTMIIDIGGQDSKIISLDENHGVRNFTMNDKCAAGTGKFIEVICGLLETTIDKVTELSLASTAPCTINDILAGIHISMAKRIARLAKKYKSSGDILMTGGGAKNGGLRTAIEDELMCDVHPAVHAQFNGAIGAALIAREREEEECQ